MNYRHIDNVQATAQFDTERGVLFRYRLDVRKLDATPSSLTVCAVMQNPSYAGEEYADKSVQFLEKNIFELGLVEFKNVGRLIIVNQYARVQTTGFLGLDSDVGSKNDKFIEEAITSSEIVLIAWGSTNRFDDRKRFVLGLLDGNHEKRLLQTRMHPSRGRYQGFILPLQGSRKSDGGESFK